MLSSEDSWLAEHHDQCTLKCVAPYFQGFLWVVPAAPPAITTAMQQLKAGGIARTAFRASPCAAPRPLLPVRRPMACSAQLDKNTKDEEWKMLLSPQE